MEMPIKHVRLIAMCLLEMKLKISLGDVITPLNQIILSLVLKMNVHNGQQENGPRYV